jgi:hypothetical protein
VTAFSQPAASAASALNASTGRRPSPSRVAEACRRWLSGFAEARLRRAAIAVLRHLDNRIPYASGAERADLVARAEALRRSLE